MNLFVVLREGAPAGPYATLEAARAASAVTVNYGIFVNTIITFVIIAFVIFLMVKTINRWRAQEPAETNTRECPQCLSTIPLKASRCAFCTSQIGATSA